MLALKSKAKLKNIVLVLVFFLHCKILKVTTVHCVSSFKIVKKERERKRKLSTK